MPFGHASFSLRGEVGITMIEAGVETRVRSSRSRTCPCRRRCRRRAQPLILAIWPTAEPTAPDAAATTTVSPGLAACRSQAGRCRRSCPACRARRSAVEIGAIVGSTLAQALAVRQRIALPAGCATARCRPWRNRGCSRLTTSADRAAFHHAVDRHRRGIGRSVAHATAHIGIERQPDRAQQHLAVTRRRHRHNPRVGNLSASARRRDGMRERYAWRTET